jgi:RNA polymerase sigma-70 factor (ECF subfamily)
MTHTNIAPLDDIDDDTPVDGELLMAIVAGNRHAFTVLYRRHAPWLLARLRRRCADAGQADEILQDTFVAVWRAAPAWDGRGQVPAWMWGIAVHRLIDSRRRLSCKTYPLSDLPESVAPRAASAEEQALLGVHFGRLGRAMARLSPDLRRVVEATALHGLTSREASCLLGIPVGTVKTRMMRARLALKAHLAAEEHQAASAIAAGPTGRG